METKGIHEDCRELLVSLLFPGVFNVLNPDADIALELACGAIHNEEDSSLTMVSQCPNSHALHSLFPKRLQVDLVLDISQEIDGLRTARIELVFKVGSLFDYGADFILFFFTVSGAELLDVTFTARTTVRQKYLAE